MKRLEKEEKELLKSYDRDEWRSIGELQEQKKKYQRYARNTFLKNKRINIRLTEKDLINIKAKSLEEGIPYQSLISSVLHKYLTGKLVESD
ncbi:MAG: antitoxin [Bacteroidetes bacterium RBG_13_42_15]|nr:MAG: antitoxin [Bacteroidetes bacterium RBG_13_42_15]